VKTVWLLDVDGVINVDRPGWGGPPCNRDIEALGRTWRVRWAPRLMSRIRALAEAGQVDLRWCTTWCPDAAKLELMWRLPPLRRALASPINHRTKEADKLAAAVDVLAAGHRLIWTDDDAIPSPGTPLYRSLVENDRALLIEPDHRRGLQPDDMERVEAFILEA